MFYDPLQRRLKQMEGENPSLNKHPQGFWKGFRERSYFSKRFLSGIVETIPQFTHRYGSNADRIFDYKKGFENVGYPEQTVNWLEEALKDIIVSGEIRSRVEKDLEIARKHAYNSGVKLREVDVNGILGLHETDMRTSGYKYVPGWLNKAIAYIELAEEKRGDAELYSLAREYLEESLIVLKKVEEEQRELEGVIQTMLDSCQPRKKDLTFSQA
ncbi:MAG: hypothetical protein ABIH25_04795 [Candidatus Woesearchaeota archaeon]